MNKVICHICGTAYPENVSECPICGFARSSEHTRENSEHTYTPVPGGRFSKANVRKRNQSSAAVPVKAAPAAKSSSKKKKKEEKTSAGLIIVVILLLLAIIAVVGYIALRFFIPNDHFFEGNGQSIISSLFNKEEEIVETEPTEDVVLETEPEYVPVSCQDISLDTNLIATTAIGETYQLEYQLTPADAEEEVLFSSSDDTVATVDSFGLVTIVGEGNAIITATCGSASAQCEVYCELEELPTEEVELVLNRKEITFTTEGESWLLYDGPVSLEEIIWTSDDTNVATIENGKVVAVGNGDTTVYGFYSGVTATCSIHCAFSDDAATEPTTVSEADGNSNRTYKLYNPHGRSDDVTIKVGGEFTLRLVDEYKNTVEGVEWKIEDSKVCSYENGVVKALAAGTTNVTATYEGRTYTCIVRVKKK